MNLRTSSTETSIRWLGSLALAVALTALNGAQAGSGDPAQPAATVLIQGADAASVASLVQDAGGIVTHELDIIQAVAARLTTAQLDRLRAQPGIDRIYDNRRAKATGKPDKGGNGGGNGSGNGNTVLDTEYPTVVRADELHEIDEDGTGGTIAFVDTGMWKYEGIVENPAGRSRLLRLYDAIADIEGRARNTSDPNGHGSHIASVATGSLVTDTGLYNGIAHGADLVYVRAFDHNGTGTYADVIRGIGCERVNALSPEASRGDQDPLDICVVSERPISRPEILLSARVVGGLQMLDGGEADDKIIAVLDKDNVWGAASDIGDLPEILVSRLRHYFLTYNMIPEAEPTAVSVATTFGREHALAVVQAAMDDYGEIYG